MPPIKRNSKMKPEIIKLLSELSKIQGQERELQGKIRKAVTMDFHNLKEAKDWAGLEAFANSLEGASAAQFFYAEAYNIRHAK